MTRFRKAFMAAVALACATSLALGPARAVPQGSPAPANNASALTTGTLSPARLPVFAGGDVSCPTGSGVSVVCTVTKIGGQAPAAVATTGQFSSLLGTLSTAQAATVAPFLPVINPSSDNFQGVGIPTNGTGHAIPFTDENVIWTADQMRWNSTDPSALLQVPLSGTRTANDIVKLCFTWSGQSTKVCVASAAGDADLPTIAADIMNQVKANATLFVAPSATNLFGGGVPNIILGVNFGGCGTAFCIDWNALLAPLAVTETVTNGGAVVANPTEYYDLTSFCGAKLGGNACNPALDNGPSWLITRNAGVAPASGSVIFGQQIAGNTTSNPTGLLTYFQQAVRILNSTTGNIQPQWYWNWADTSGHLTHSLFIGPGGIHLEGAADPGTGSLAVPYKLVAGQEVDAVSASGNGIMRILGLDGNAYIGNSSAYPAQLNLQTSNATIGATLDTNSNLTANGTINGSLGGHLGGASASGAVATLQNSAATCTHTPTTASETVSCSSDARLKAAIVDSRTDIKWLDSFHIHEYRTKSDGTMHTGVIAQELQRTHPEMVHVQGGGMLAAETPDPWKMMAAMQGLSLRIKLFEIWIALLTAILVAALGLAAIRAAHRPRQS